MKKLTVILLVIFSALLNELYAHNDDSKGEGATIKKVSFSEEEVLNLCHAIELEDDIEFETFKRALTGYETFPCKKKRSLRSLILQNYQRKKGYLSLTLRKKVAL